MSDGGADLNDEAIKAFGQAVHALEDMGSPAHVDADGTPRTWTGGRAAGLVHVFAERSESVDWLRIGQTIRLAIAGFAQAFPKLAQKQGSLESWAQRAIESLVESSLPKDPSLRDPIVEGATRLCALGNPAACIR